MVCQLGFLTHRLRGSKVFHKGIKHMCPCCCTCLQEHPYSRKKCRSNVNSLGLCNSERYEFPQPLRPTCLLQQLFRDSKLPVTRIYHDSNKRYLTYPCARSNPDSNRFNLENNRA
jgi:hypothetical protein